MKKVFAFAAMFAAVAMVSCGGQQKANEEATEETKAMECCEECDGDCEECEMYEECCGECCEAALEAIDEADLAEAVELTEAALEAAEELDFE